MCKGNETKTVIIWDEKEAGITFVVLDGNYSHLNNVYINSSDQMELVDELSSLIFDEEGKYKLTHLDAFPENDVRSGARVIVAGFLP